MPLSSAFKEQSQAALDRRFYYPELSTPVAGATETATRTPVPTNPQGISAFGNLSRLLGGGQYNIAPNSNQLIKDERGFQTFKERAAVRGPYATESVGIDHIIPLSLGGTNDLTNVQLLPKDQFDHKTIYDNLAAAMYRTGHISLGLARNFNKNWNNNPVAMLSPEQIQAVLDDPKIPDKVTLEGKTYNLKDALRKPEDQTKVTLGKVLKEIPQAAADLPFKVLKALPKLANEYLGAPLYGLAAGLFKGENVGDATRQYYEEAKNGVLEQRTGIKSPFQGPLMEAPKRLLQALSFNYLKPTPEDMNTDAEKLTGKISGALGYGLGIGLNLEALAKGVTTLAGTKLLAPATRLIANTSLAKSLSAAPKIASLLKNAGLFGLYGQISEQEPGKFTDLENRAHVALHDVINGGLYSLGSTYLGARFPTSMAGTTSYANVAKGITGNAFMGYVVSKMEGATDEDALMNAGVFGALHGYGIYNDRFQLQVQQVAQKEANDIFRQLGVNKKITSTAQANTAFTLARSNLAREVADGYMTHEQAVPLMQQATLAYKTLLNSYLPFKTQVSNQMKDLASAYVASKNEKIAQRQANQQVADTSRADNETVRFAQESRKLADTLPPEIQFPALTGEIKAPGTAITSHLEDRFMTTGMAEQTNSLANQNQRNVIELMQNPDAKVDIILEREKTNPADPNAVAVKAVVDDGRPIPLGYVPRQQNIETNQNTKLWVLQNPERYPPFNPETNNVLFAAQMDALGINRVKANVETSEISQASGQPFMILKVPLSAWEQSTLIHDQPRPAEQPLIKYNNHQQYFDQLPDTQIKTSFQNFVNKIDQLTTSNKGDDLVRYLRTFGEVTSPQIEDVIRTNTGRLNYENIFSLLSEARKQGKLNADGEAVANTMDQFMSEFLKVHGRNAALKFLTMPVQNSTATLSQPATAVPTTATPGTVQPETNIETQKIQPEEIAPVVVPPEEVIRQTQEAAVKTPTAKNIFLNQALDLGIREVKPNDYNNFGDSSRLSGVSKRVVNKIVELLNGGADKSDPQVNELFKFYNNLTRDKMSTAAQKSSSFDDFLERYVAKTESLGIDAFDGVKGKPISADKYYDKFDNEQLQELKHRYFMLQQTPTEGKALVIKASRDGGLSFNTEEIQPAEPLSWMQTKVIESPYRGLEILRVKDDKPDVGGAGKLKGPAGRQVEQLATEMRKKNIFMVSDQNADPGNTQGVHINPENYQRMLDKYNANPGKYEITDQEMINNMREHLTTGDKVTEDMKVMQVFFQDVLHLGQNVDAPMITKRINLLDHRAVQYNKPGKMRILFFPATELAKIAPELPDFVQKNPEKYKELLEKFQEDGARFMFPEDMDQIRYDLGYTGTSKNIKGTVVFELPEGGVIAEKGNTGTLHGQLRQTLEKKYGIILKPGEIVSFLPNVKLGESSLRDLPEKPDIKYLDINKSDMRYLFEQPKDDQQGTMVFSTLGKFSAHDFTTDAGTTMGIKDDLMNLFKPAAEKWLKAWNEVYVDGQNPVSVFEKYYGNNMEETGFGKLKSMARNGADVISLKRQFETNMLSKFRDTVMRNRNLKSAYLKLIPDLGFWDANTNKYRMLKSDEIMMSREMSKELGNPEAVLTSRFPITKKLALSKLKVLVAEDYGIDGLGKDDIIDNVFDVYIRKEGDWDGDGLTVHNIIPKKQADLEISQGKELSGIPETIANHIEQERLKYINEKGGETNPQGIESAKYPRLPASSLEGLLFVSGRAADAKQQLGGISNHSNLVNMFSDNAGDPTSRAVFTVDGKYYAPRVNFDIIDNIGKMLQAAVDATGKDAFSKMSKTEKDPLSSIFGTTDEKVLSKLSQNIYKTYMAGLRLNKTKYPSVGGYTSRGGFVPGMIKDLNEFLKITPQDASQQHPIQGVLKLFEGLFAPEVTNKHIWDSDMHASAQVKLAIPQPKMTENAKKFIEFVERQQDLKSGTYQKLRKATGLARDELQNQFDDYRDVQNIYDFYYTHADGYSKADREAISWFLITDPNGNQWYDKNFATQNQKAGYYVERFDDLFVPEQAKAYYAARQEWFNQNVAKNRPNPTSSVQETPPVQNPTGEKVPLLAGFPNLQQKTKDIVQWNNFKNLKKLQQPKSVFRVFLDKYDPYYEKGTANTSNIPVELLKNFRSLDEAEKAISKLSGPDEQIYTFNPSTGQIGAGNRNYVIKPIIDTSQ